MSSDGGCAITAEAQPDRHRFADAPLRSAGEWLLCAFPGRLFDAGWQTRIEVNVTELLGRGFDRDYGDVDVLAWRPDAGRVLIIECKNVQYRKTYGEIAEQLADFRGEIRANGKRDELRKHLDRMDLIRQHLGAVERFTGLTNVRDVESHLMFRHPVPMEFALQKMAEKVRVSRFDQISSI